MINLSYRNQKNAEIISAYWKKPLNKPDWFTIQAATATSPAEAYIYGPVGWPYVCEDELVRALAAIKDEPVLARISSPGGDVFAGIAVANAFANHPGGVTARIESMAASIASVIPMGCRKIQAYSNSMMMIHNSWLIAAGNRIELLELADVLEMVDDIIMESYTKKTKIGKKEMRDMMRAETYMNATMMKGRGFIDEIIPSGKAAKAAFDLSIFANLPEEFRAENDIFKPEPDIRSIEKLLRDVGGLSKSKTKALLARGWQAIGDDNNAPEEAAKDDEEYRVIAAEVRNLITKIKGK